MDHPTLFDRVFTRVIPLAALTLAAVALATALSTKQPVTAVNQSAAVQSRGINADRVDGLHASKKPRAGRILALDRRAKFPASVLPSGFAGPQGPAGAAGPVGAAGSDGADGATGPTGAVGSTGATGPAGISGREVVTAESANDATDLKAVYVNCPSPKLAVGGGGAAVAESATPQVALTVSQSMDLGFPFNSSGWIAYANEITALATDWKLVVNAICVNVAA